MENVQEDFQAMLNATLPGEMLDSLVFAGMEAAYFAMFSVDLESGYMKVLKNVPNEALIDTGEPVFYEPAIKDFANRFEGETKEFFVKVADIEYLKKRFAKEDKIVYLYKSHLGGGTKWASYTQTVVRRTKDGTPSLMVTAFSLLDEDASKLQDAREQLKEDMEMIGGLASGYYTLYYYSFEENTFKVYSLDNKSFDASCIVEGEDNPLEMLRKFGLSELVHPDDRYIFEEITPEGVKDNLAHSKKMTIRFRRNFEGKYLWTEMDIVKFADVDEPVDGVAIGFANRDKEIRYEEERREELEKARKAADAANESKTNFLFSMSHDIRTPMNAISGFTAMAKKYSYDREKVLYYLDKIDLSGQQMLALINQVLEMSRIEAGKLELELVPVNIQDKFNSAVTVLIEQANAKGIHFTYSLKNVSHAFVLADEARMSSITFNILGNAMKYTPEGGMVEFSLEEIPTDKEGKARYLFTVQDNGIGMSEEFVEKIYEPFSREKNTTVGKIQGTGLGMSIVKNLVDFMGGTIDVKTKVGEGTRFDVTIDFDIDEKASGKPSYNKKGDKMSFEGMRVLLVDDNEMNREIAKYILSEYGFTVDEADDGKTAVSTVKAAFDCKDYDFYDYILMDVQMPGMDGYEATRQIRALPRPDGKHIPIIAMTANAFAEDKQNALNAGMDDHLSKPIDIRKMLETLGKFK